MKIKANIKVMNDVTFSQPVTFETETNTGAIEMRVLDKIIALNRGELAEFLERTEPVIQIDKSA
jgi:ATP sulfurylase